MGRVVGVDGCKYGWIAVTGEGSTLDYQLFRSIQQLLAFYREAERLLVDIPIGLPWKDCPTRPCDSLARQKLGHRHVCVFPAPSRAACHAGTKVDARRHNRDDLGKSLSEQALAIRDKVAEVDDLLLADPSARSRVREVHPEVCFWALNNCVPMNDAKATPAGIQTRLAVLSLRLPQTAGLLERVLRERLRADVRADDVLDATAAYLTARATSAELFSLHGEPTLDQKGLPMEMVYIK
jgi:predicted RNase H-like nuclease